MALAAQFIAINPWVTQTGLPLQCQEKVALLKLQAWPGEEDPGDSCGQGWHLCWISTCQAPCLSPGVHKDKVRSLVCMAWGQQHPNREMHLPAREGSQPCCMPWDSLAVHPEGLPASLHPLEALGDPQTSSEELGGKHMAQLKVLAHLATNTFGGSTEDAQRPCSSLQPAHVKCWTSEEAHSGGATFKP